MPKRLLTWDKTTIIKKKKNGTQRERRRLPKAVGRNGGNSPLNLYGLKKEGGGFADEMEISNRIGRGG